MECYVHVLNSKQLIAKCTNPLDVSIGTHPITTGWARARMEYRLPETFTDDEYLESNPALLSFRLMLFSTDRALQYLHKLPSQSRAVSVQSGPNAMLPSIFMKANPHLGHLMYVYVVYLHKLRKVSV